MTGNAKSFDEKRDFIRMHMDTPSIIVLDKQEFPGKCIDLSSSGIQLQNIQAIEVNSQVTVKIQGGNGNDGLTIMATILRVNKLVDGSYRYGACIDSYL